MILERNPFPMEKNNKQFRTSIGGQALIEGILMRGPEKQAIVVRSPEGLVTKVEELTREVREHNHFAQRVPVVEEQIKVINHRISDLEAYHK